MRSHRFVLVAAALSLLGCPNTSAPSDAPVGIDAALPSGPFACGATSCAEGQICLVTERSGGGTDTGPSPDDAGVPGMCVPRPAACGSQGDCALSSCISACVSAVCELIPGYQTSTLVVSNVGRTYLCRFMADAS